MGSVRENGTAELVLGDRFLSEGEKDNNPQIDFDFLKGMEDFDISEFKKIDFFD